MDQKVTSAFIIERGVPMGRVRTNGAWRKYPFDTMSPGDSFAVPVEIDVEKLRNAATAFGKIHKMKFSVLLIGREPAQYRCWRTE